MRGQYHTSAAGIGCFHMLNQIVRVPTVQADETAVVLGNPNQPQHITKIGSANWAERSGGVACLLRVVMCRLTAAHLAAELFPVVKSKGEV